VDETDETPPQSCCAVSWEETGVESGKGKKFSGPKMRIGEKCSMGKRKEGSRASSGRDENTNR